MFLKGAENWFGCTPCEVCERDSSSPVTSEPSEVSWRTGLLYARDAGKIIILSFHLFSRSERVKRSNSCIDRPFSLSGSNYCRAQRQCFVSVR